MMRKSKSFISVPLLTLLCLCLLCGCWDKNELNELAVVLGVGIDQAKTPDEIDVTAQIEKNGKTSQSSSSSSGGRNSEGQTSESNYINVLGTGKDVPTIFVDYSHALSRRMYISQNQIIIFGETLARNGIQDSMDYFLRDYQGRLTVYLFVAKGRAEDILNLKPTMGKIPAYEISQLMDMQAANSESMKLDVGEAMTDLASRTKSMIAPYLEIKDNDGKKHFEISGAAVFKGSKLIGELDKDETQGYLWAADKVRSGKISVTLLDEQATLEIRRAKSRVYPEIKDDGSIWMKLNVMEGGSLVSQTGSNSLDTPQNAKLLESAVSEAIRAKIMRTFDKTREMGTDIYGFGELIHQRYPQKWSDMEKDWDNLYKNIHFEVNVKVNVPGGGRIMKPDYPNVEAGK